MNSRERMIKAIEFDEPDRIPVTTWRAEGLDEWLYYKGHERDSSEIGGGSRSILMTPIIPILHG